MGSIVNWTIAAGLVIALGLVGWWVKLKVDRAYEADALEAQLQQANDTITIYRTNLNRAITESKKERFLGLCVMRRFPAMLVLFALLPTATEEDNNTTLHRSQ